MREHLTFKIINVKNKLDECIITKTSYEKFVHSNLNAIQVASYGMCTLNSVLESVTDTWKKELESMKSNFIDCISRITNSM